MVWFHLELIKDIHSILNEANGCKVFLKVLIKIRNIGVQWAETLENRNTVQKGSSVTLREKVSGGSITMRERPQLYLGSFLGRADHCKHSNNKASIVKDTET